MMKNITEKLEALEKNDLIEITIDMANSSEKTAKFLDNLLASKDPKQLARLLKKDVALLSKSAHSYDYKQGNEVSNIIYEIIGQVEKHLVAQAPELGVDILKRLIQVDTKLFDHIDDSYGYLGTAYYSLYKVLDKAFANSSISADEIAKYIIETYRLFRN